MPAVKGRDTTLYYETHRTRAPLLLVAGLRGGGGPPRPPGAPYSARHPVDGPVPPRGPPFPLPPPWFINAHAPELRAEQAASATYTTVPIAARRIDAILAFDRAAELDRIRTPTLVVGARDDRLTPAYFSEALAE